MIKELSGTKVPLTCLNHLSSNRPINHTIYNSNKKIQTYMYVGELPKTPLRLRSYVYAGSFINYE